MLRSSNPILSKKDAFTPAAPSYGQGYAGYSASPQGYPQTGAGWGGSGYGSYTSVPPAVPEARMTFDDVITKTAVVMAVLIAAAAAAWWLVPTTLYLPVLILSALVGFGTVLLVSFRRVVSPPLVFVYAAVEGVFIGMISKLFNAAYNGIVTQAVLGTFVAAGLTLAAYKLFNIRVTARFTKVLFIATAAFAVTMLINFVFALLGINLGFRAGLYGPVQPLAILFSAIGVVLAVLNLVLDFDYIERGVAMGAPANESWRGAFGLTVTMVWLYVEILRILSYIRR